MSDNILIQAPDKLVKGEKYWFFKYFPEDTIVDVLDIGRKSLFQKLEKKIKFYILQPMKAFFRRNKYDVVISHGAQSGLLYELLTSFSRKKPVHIMIDVGGLNGSRANYQMPIIRFALRKCPIIVTHTSGQLDFYRQYYPQQYPDVHFIPFGVDCDYFSKFHTETRTEEIVSFGYMKRDYDTLCQAFLRMENSRYTLHIYGNTELKEKYCNYNNIIFSPNIPLSQLINAIQASAFVVIPLPEYKYAYGQMSFLQSMALGKAVIVTKTTSSIDYLAKAESVILVKPNDIESMKEGLLKFCEMPEDVRIKKGEYNSQYVKTNFDEQRMANELYKLLIR
jgi:glycosyltransferase involved in cell wall biosynthesis